MITFGLNYDVKAEHVDEFVGIAKKALELINTLEGHVKTVLYSNVEKPNSFMIYSEWESDEPFRNFMRSDAFKQVQTMSVDMLENRPKHSLYESRKMS
ncbi:antibiotic biosynthesis monooxygenase [bacterium (Candidatus Blackallbacteria) CG17_big_fil_post_rev_8_21_14_2_50_48_46]|uniref:Antibiotic biosynthesis monooxygenase n=1 Tax=bacterium (Candidatus Blackallbacteria) CG17_big_fil_post_rev_8_21_14_2_50_48_46 TaxID=2014261 RepID=A0A2M7G5X2_9BACT|nr:MAG: antibiotic biosynthesis monooxygenase [bacterium (Candidatus Blackallbacteria) CG18_big_fil_WC_8_21_14_2_50_49_26]PIW16995.1 MAG: antibiotic biosynthesis monooxygenase [bacterium (Candidatus Blackallbacteria) CG17_big_fil_post_rev_8_21_14_2_50_48_46]PIW48197.1 MAG: antibiotic biosynthesis monooxygenase [bacterium (Candidatus Blackallbacteria) CG13_big_fil_rev_8_21_14_2_50_49_14]